MRKGKNNFIFLSICCTSVDQNPKSCALSARWCPTTYSWCPFYIFSPLPLEHPESATALDFSVFGFFLSFVMIQCLVVFSVLFWYHALVCHFLLFSFSCVFFPLSVFLFLTSPLSPHLFPPHLFLIPWWCVCVHSLCSPSCVCQFVPSYRRPLSVAFSSVSHIGMFGFWFLDFCICVLYL